MTSPRQTIAAERASALADQISDDAWQRIVKAAETEYEMTMLLAPGQTFNDEVAEVAIMATLEALVTEGII